MVKDSVSTWLMYLCSPLPQEMLDYARSDTHFLLFVYDNLRNAILDRGKSESAAPLIMEVLRKSQDTALGIYKRDIYDYDSGSGSNGWDTLARKWNKPIFFANAPVLEGPLRIQREVYKALHSWRDKVAREEDESIRFVDRLDPLVLY